MSIRIRNFLKGKMDSSEFIAAMESLDKGHAPNLSEQRLSKLQELAQKEPENPSALYELGMYYFDTTGDVNESRKEKALDLFEKASQLGNKEATYKLGECYFDGNFYKQDYKKAFEIFNSLAQENHPWGQYMLAGCYENGLGTYQDKNKAMEWYRKSSESGNDFAEMQLQNMQAQIQERNDALNGKNNIEGNKDRPDSKTESIPSLDLI